ncbi:MAG TPA: GNAT family N-acetyltransferase [Candidatus Angelobacter sp.]|jgi:RimJ/RimL family protein N-acetyltransferase|nr:GNAT family N-acetyltransferase [Candidatus Angelobacter sp.]
MSSGSPLLRREGSTADGRRWLIRPSRPDEDAAELIAIRDEVAAEGELIAGAPGERSALEENLALANLLVAGGLALTLVVDDRVVGNLLVERRRGRYESHRGDVSMAIRKGFRGAGLGRALLDAAVDWGRAVGIAKLTLGVFPTNQPALALYRAVGFEAEGVLRDHLRLPAGDRDVLLMGLAL